MIATLALTDTAQKYLENERKNLRESVGKYEFLDNHSIFMSGATTNHNIICHNWNGLLWYHLRDKDYLIAQADLRVHNPEKNSFFYPDLVVIANEPAYLDEEFDTILNPLLIVEVLSEATEAYDRGKKFTIYRQLPSFREYVLVAQNAMSVDVYFHKANGDWQINSFTQPNDMIHLQSLDIQLKLADIYAKVKFVEE
ncbi:MAG: Uma2 family endonuclease [Microscillaceae bacterium]|jgi:Uma2 family endonuclease|nr:Uma2 family endonuclease [Microscillaceae bacterium]